MEANDSYNSVTNARLKFGRWRASWILGAFISVTCLYYVLFHLLLRIPIPLLYWPAVVHIAATVAPRISARRLRDLA